MKYLTLRYLLSLYEAYKDSEVVKDKKKRLNDYIAQVVGFYDELRCAEIFVRSLNDKVMSIELKLEDIVVEYLSSVISDNKALSSLIRDIREELLIKEKVAETIRSNFVDGYKTIFQELYAMSQKIRGYADESYYNKRWFNDDNIQKLSVEHLLAIKLISCNTLKRYIETKYNQLSKEIESDKDRRKKVDKEKKPQKSNREVEVSKAIREAFPDKSKETKEIASDPAMKARSKKVEEARRVEKSRAIPQKEMSQNKAQAKKTPKEEEGKTKASVLGVKPDTSSKTESEKKKKYVAGDIKNIKPKTVSPKKDTEGDETEKNKEDKRDDKKKKVSISSKSKAASPSAISKIAPPEETKNLVDKNESGTETVSFSKEAEAAKEDKDKKRKDKRRAPSYAKQSKRVRPSSKAPKSPKKLDTEKYSDRRRDDTGSEGQLMKSRGYEKNKYRKAAQKHSKEQKIYLQSFEGDNIQMNNKKSSINEGENKLFINKNDVKESNKINIYNEIKEVKQLSENSEGESSASKTLFGKTLSDEEMRAQDTKSRAASAESDKGVQESKNIFLSIKRSSSMDDQNEKSNIMKPNLLKEYEEKKNRDKKQRFKFWDKLSQMKDKIVEQSLQSKSRLVGAIRAFGMSSTNAAQSNSIFAKILSFIGKVIGFVPQLFTLGFVYKSMDADTKIGELEKDSLMRNLMRESLKQSLESDSASVTIKSVRGEAGRANIGLYAMTSTDGMTRNINVQGGKGAMQTKLSNAPSASDYSRSASLQSQISQQGPGYFREQERAELERIRAEQEALKAQLDSMKRLNEKYAEASTKIDQDINNASQQSALQRKVAANVTSNKNDAADLSMYNSY